MTEAGGECIVFDVGVAKADEWSPWRIVRGIIQLLGLNGLMAWCRVGLEQVVEGIQKAKCSHQ